MDLRCRYKLHGVLRDEEVVEFKCDSKFCGHRPGKVVVIHRFNIRTGELLKTMKFQDPRSKRRIDGSSNQSAAVRSA